MNRIKDFTKSALGKVTELGYASTPYIGSIWSAISTGNILEASPLALASAAKEHYFQYTELIKDTENASSYTNNARLYIKYLEESEPICNMKKVKSAFDDLSELVSTLQNDKGIREHLAKQQVLLNNTLIEYNKTHDVNKYVSNVQSISSKLFVKSWPGWYRMELNSQINRMNIIFDEIMFELSSSKKKACAAPVKLKKIAVEEPISLDQQDDEIFYDAVENQGLKQQAGGARKLKTKSKLKLKTKSKSKTPSTLKK